MDYSAEGLKSYQYDAAVRQLHAINKSLKKISRNFTLITLIGVGVTAYKIGVLKYVKGE